MYRNDNDANIGKTKTIIDVFEHPNVSCSNTQ